MITGIEILKTEPVSGLTFGKTGAYEKVTGVATGELDPSHPANRVIVDLDKAPLNARGKVEYKTDFVIMRPADPAKGNGRILYATTNRGGKQLFGHVGDAESDAGDLTDPKEFGNGLPLKMGFTIVWSGWDPFPPDKGKVALMLQTPVATDNGKVITGKVRDEFIYKTRTQGGEVFRLSDLPVSLDTKDAQLEVRTRRSDKPTPIPAEGWKFVNDRAIQLTTAPVPGAIYELRYTAKNPRVLGVGYASVRDLVSYLRNEPGARAATGGAVTHTLGIGFSQGGRFLHDLVAQGFNGDEQGRRVLDGILAHTGGAGRVFLNTRFGQPGRTRTQHQDYNFPEAWFPFSTAATTDPVSGRTAGIFHGDKTDPLMMQTNTPSEYWQKGASLAHTDPTGKKDLTLPPGSRFYMLAGTQHGGKAHIKPDYGPCANLRNPHSPMPILRALLVALDEWVATGRKPPDSRVPTIAGGTLIPAESVKFPAIQGAGFPRGANDMSAPEDWANPASMKGREYRPLVSQVDADGNEVAGVRTPDISVPLATYTGWNVYKKPPYPAGEMADRDGSYIPFMANAAERKESGDPRPSLAERYPSADDYVKKVAAAANALLQDRLLLQEDVDAYVARARDVLRDLQSRQPAPKQEAAAEEFKTTAF